MDLQAHVLHSIPSRAIPTQEMELRNLQEEMKVCWLRDLAIPLMNDWFCIATDKMTIICQGLRWVIAVCVALVSFS